MSKKIKENLEGKYSDKFRSLAKKYFFEDNAEALKSLVDNIIRYAKEEDLKDLWVDRGYDREMPDEEMEETLQEYDDILDRETDFDDGSVVVGGTFVEDGKEWQFVESVGDEVHLDFDTWQVWAAFSLEPGDDPDNRFFVVDVDTGFIDWGPVDTAEEAKEFLASKVSDWEEDDTFEVEED